MRAGPDRGAGAKPAVQAALPEGQLRARRQRRERGRAARAVAACRAPRPRSRHGRQRRAHGLGDVARQALYRASSGLPPQARVPLRR